jgi:hypothetical protein
MCSFDAPSRTRSRVPAHPAQVDSSGLLAGVCRERPRASWKACRLRIHQVEARIPFLPLRASSSQNSRITNHGSHRREQWREDKIRQRTAHTRQGRGSDIGTKRQHKRRMQAVPDISKSAPIDHLHPARSLPRPPYRLPPASHGRPESAPPQGQYPTFAGLDDARQNAVGMPNVAQFVRPTTVRSITEAGPAHERGLYERLLPSRPVISPVT